MGSTCAKSTCNVCDDSTRTRSARYGDSDRTSARRQRDAKHPQNSFAPTAAAPVSAMGSGSGESLSLPSMGQRGGGTVKQTLSSQLQEHLDILEESLVNVELQSDTTLHSGANLMQPTGSDMQSPPLDKFKVNTNSTTVSFVACRSPEEHKNDHNNSSAKGDIKRTKAEIESSDVLKEGESSNGSSASSTPSVSDPYLRWPSAVVPTRGGSSPLPRRPVPALLHRKRMQQKRTSVGAALCDHVLATEVAERQAIADAEEGERQLLVDQYDWDRQRVLLQYPTVQADLAAEEFGDLAVMATDKGNELLDGIPVHLLRDDEVFARKALCDAEDEEWRVLFDGFMAAKQRIEHHIEQLREQQLDFHAGTQGGHEWQTHDFWGQRGHLFAFPRHERWPADGARAASSVASAANDSDSAPSPARAACPCDGGGAPPPPPAAAAAPGPRRRVPLTSPSPDLPAPVRGCLATQSPRAPPVAAPSETIALGKWLPPLRMHLPPLMTECGGSRCSTRSCASPQPQSPSEIGQSTTTDVSSSMVRGGKRICRWCDEPYDWRDVCLVAQKSHVALRQQRRQEKRVKKRAQVLLRKGYVQDALGELRSAELI